MYLNNVFDGFNNQVGGASKSTYVIYFLIFVYIISPALFTGLSLGGVLKKDEEGNPAGPRGTYTNVETISVAVFASIFTILCIVGVVHKWKSVSGWGWSSLKTISYTIGSLILFSLWVAYISQAIDNSCDADTNTDTDADRM